MTEVNNPEDVKKIRDLHVAWLESNNGLDPEKMYPLFANPGYLQFNLNGHEYHGPDEKWKLWEGLHQIGFNLSEMTIVEEPKIHVEGGLGYLTTYWSTIVTGVKEKGTGLMEPDPEPLVFRVTEVYRRDDGKGNPEWKIWHFHASPIAAAGSQRFPQDS